jgi:hypothetical protein
MNKKTNVAAVLFALLEGYFPVRSVLIALSFALHVPMNNDVYDILILLLSLALGGVISWLLFVKWRAKFGMKLVVAAAVFLVTFAISLYFIIGSVQQNVDDSGSYIK